MHNKLKVNKSPNYMIFRLFIGFRAGSRNLVKKTQVREMILIFHSYVLFHLPVFSHMYRTVSSSRVQLVCLNALSAFLRIVFYIDKDPTVFWNYIFISQTNIKSNTFALLIFISTAPKNHKYTKHFVKRAIHFLIY